MADAVTPAKRLRRSMRARIRLRTTRSRTSSSGVRRRTCAATTCITPKLQLEFGGYLSNTTFVGSRFDPRGGLTWRPNSKFSVRASAGSAYSTPYQGVINPTSTICAKSTFCPATQFQAETSMGYDVGADYKYARDSIVSADFYSNDDLQSLRDDHIGAERQVRRNAVYEHPPADLARPAL